MMGLEPTYRFHTSICNVTGTCDDKWQGCDAV